MVSGTGGGCDRFVLVDCDHRFYRVACLFYLEGRLKVDVFSLVSSELLFADGVQFGDFCVV